VFKYNWNEKQAGSGHRPSRMEEDCIGSQGSNRRVVLDKEEKDGKVISNRRTKITINYYHKIISQLIIILFLFAHHLNRDTCRFRRFGVTCCLCFQGDLVKCQ